MTPRAASVVLLLLTAAAAPAVGQDPFDAPVAPEGDGTSATSIDDRVLLNGLATMPATTTEAFTGRPLFSPSRRPRPVAEPEPEPEVVVLPEEPSEPEIDEPPAAPTMQLTGTFEGPDGIAALMRDPSTGQSMTARQGDDVEGWAVTAITPTTITLEQAGAVLDLALFEPTPVGDEADLPDTSGEWGDGEDPTMGPSPDGGWPVPDDSAGASDPPPALSRSARPPGARPPRSGFDPAGLDPTMSGG